MNQDVELLNYILENAQMGKDSIQELLKRVEDPQFRSLLQNQMEGYQTIYDRTSDKIDRMGGEKKQISPMTKTMSEMMIKMKTLTDHSPSHVSEMMLQGSNMGIIDMTKRMNHYQSADSEIVGLANHLQEFEQNNVESLKKFL